MNSLFKTGMLLAAMTAIFMAAGAALGGQGGMMIALLMALGMNMMSYWYSDSILLKMYGAKQVSSGQVYDMVQELTQSANMPMPKVYVIDTDQPNAFATGRNPQNAAVAVTRGIMRSLNERELRGVLAHELAHILNRDTLIMTITATIAGALGMLANYAMFFGGRRDEQGGGGLVSALAVMILAPIAASLVQMAISRTREYAADREGALIARDPLALASALQKIEQAAGRAANHVAEQNPATAHLFIINPLHMHQIDGLFSTHPKTSNRIKALQELAHSMNTHAEQAPAKVRATKSSRKTFSLSADNNFKSPWE